MKYFLGILCCLPFVFSCNNNQHSNSLSITDSSQFYPLSHFFQQQIDDVELGNFALSQMHEINGKRDSGSISKDDFQTIAALFLKKDISGAGYKGRFTETVFHDLSTQSYTLNYKPKDPSEQIQNIDILLDEKNNQVKRVFIRSEWQQKDTMIVEQCNWRAGHSFQINRFSTTNGGYRSNTLHQILWKKEQP